MTNVELVGWISLVVSVLCVVIAQIAYSRDMYWVRRHASRFPMFAVRDGLVELVAEGTVDEREMGWCATYITTNSLLELQRSHSVWSQLRDFVRHKREMRRDPVARQTVDQIMDAVKQLANREPKFAALLSRLGRAERDLKIAQVHLWDIIPLLILVGLAFTLSFIFDPFGRKRAERKRAEETDREERQLSADRVDDSPRRFDWVDVVRPDADELVGWRVHRREDRAAAA